MLLLPVEAAVEAAVEEAELPQAVSMPPTSISESADWNSLLFFHGVFSFEFVFHVCSRVPGTRYTILQWGNQNCTREGSRFWRSLFIQTSSRKITPRMPWMNALETPTISRPLFRAATVKAPSRPA